MEKTVLVSYDKYRRILSELESLKGRRIKEGGGATTDSEEKVDNKVPDGGKKTVYGKRKRVLPPGDRRDVRGSGVVDKKVSRNEERTLQSVTMC